MSIIPALFLSPSFAGAEEDAVEVIEVVAETFRVEVPPQDSPRSISIITEQDLELLAPKKLDESLRYVAGVTSQPFGSDNDTDWIRVRGLEAATYLDGSRLFRDGFYTWLLEPYGLQRIEVVKGPSAILFGESSPGGIVNAIQKKPTNNTANEVLAEAGNLGRLTLGVDASGGLGESESTRYRVVGAFKTQEGELDFTENDRIYIAPSVSMEFSDSTLLTVSATFLQDDGIPTNGFFPAAGTLLPSNFGSIDPTTNYGEPSDDIYERTQYSAGYNFEYDLNDTYRFVSTLNYAVNELLLRSTYAFFNSDPTVSELPRGALSRDGDNKSLTLDNHVIADWSNGRLDQTFLVGFDVQDHTTEGNEQDQFFTSTVNVIEPVYGNFTPLDPSSDIDREISKEQISVYAQYHFEFDFRWSAMLGARYDDVRTENVSVLAGQDQSRDDDELSLNLGLMYKAENGLSPYASYSQSYEVLSTIDFATGELYRPLDGEQVEVGVKYVPDVFDGFLNVAWFDITEENALVTNPDTFIATQTGEETSTGVEIEFAGQLSDRIQLSAAYTYTKAETDESSGQGRRQVALIPEHAASTFINYDASFDGVEGLNIGLGVRYVGETQDNPRSSDLSIPSVTLFDAVISYQASDGLNFQLNVNNITDKEYISGCDFWCYFGESRSVTLGARYSW
ncbi:MAG: TonB-dependent siderophore receptor [Pseudomonadota bacterium]